MFTKDQMIAYDAYVEACTQVISNKHYQDPFWKNAELAVINGFASLVVLNDNLADEIITNCKEPAKVMEILDRVPADHPSRSYLALIKSMPPKVRSIVVKEAMLTVNQLDGVLNELKAKSLELIY